MMKSNASRATIILAVMGALFGGVVGYRLPTPEVKVNWSSGSERPNEYHPSFSLKGGEEIAFIFIGASSCPASSREDVISSVRSAKRVVANRLDSLDVSYTTIGVAKDWSTQKGTDYLERFGAFSQVVAGGNWMNMAIMKYVHGEMAGKAATPQLLIVHRVVKGIESSAFSIERETLLLRKVGVSEIKLWASSGYPIPEV